MLGQHLSAQMVGEKLPKDYDVTVIGSGAGGAIAAKILAESGLRVLILEQGPFRTAKDFSLREADAYPYLYQDVASRKTLNQGIKILQGQSVGGSTTVNWTASFRTPEAVLDHWQTEFGATGLKIALGPEFDFLEQELNIKPWSIQPNANNTHLKKGCEALGFKAKVIPRNVLGCANLGYCGMGCPINAKQSMLVTAIPDAIKAGANIVSRAKVVDLRLSQKGQQSVQVQPLDEYGKATADRLSFKARHIVLAAGAIGSPGVLLRSDVPDPFKQIGRRTFLHPTVASAALMPEPVDGFQGAPQSIYSDNFLWRDGLIGDLGYKLEVPPLHPVLSSTILPGFGAGHAELMAHYRYMQVTIALLRDGFNPLDSGGQVVLNKFNQAILDYPIPEHYWPAVVHSLDSMAQIQFAAGAKQAMPIHIQAQLSNSLGDYRAQLAGLPMREQQMNIFSAHVMGGCAMGSDIEKSLVTVEGRYHHHDGLSIMDGSVLPTSLGVNPQLTIFALIRRNAKLLASHLH